MSCSTKKNKFEWRAVSSNISDEVKSSSSKLKSRVIENVSAKSIVSLQAQVLREHERLTRSSKGIIKEDGDDGAKLIHEFNSTHTGVRIGNKGVQRRAEKDVAPAQDTSVSGIRAALEYKSRLYAELSSRVGGKSLESERYDVDFAAKAYQKDIDSYGGGISDQDMLIAGMRRKRLHRNWESAVEADETAELSERDVIFDIEKNTERERDFMADLKRNREDNEGKKKKKLRDNFLLRLSNEKILLNRHAKPSFN